MNNELEEMKKEIKQLNLVVGTMAVWLAREFGEKNVEDLLKILNGEDIKVEPTEVIE